MLENHKKLNAQQNIRRDLILFQPKTFGREIHDVLIANHWNVSVANDLKQVFDLFRKHTFHVGLCVVSDCKKGQCIAGTECCKLQELNQLNRLLGSYPHTNWVMAVSDNSRPKAAHNSPESELIAQYCYDYITYPVDSLRTQVTLGHAYGMNQITRPFQCHCGDSPSHFGIIGESTPMKNLFRLLYKVASEDCSVLIGGGQELEKN